MRIHVQAAQKSENMAKAKLSDAEKAREAARKELEQVRKELCELRAEVDRKTAEAKAAADAKVKAETDRKLLSARHADAGPDCETALPDPVRVWNSKLLMSVLIERKRIDRVL